MKKKYKIIILFVITIVLLLLPITLNTIDKFEQKDVGMAKVVKKR
jgi:hypothetical protein